MSEISASTTSADAQKMRTRIDALQRGECSEDDFVREVLGLRASSPNLVWTVLALIDQRYRLGHLSVDLFRSVKARLAREELARGDRGAAVELQPATPAPGKAAEPPAPPEVTGPRSPSFARATRSHTIELSPVVGLADPGNEHTAHLQSGASAPAPADTPTPNHTIDLSSVVDSLGTIAEDAAHPQIYSVNYSAAEERVPQLGTTEVLTMRVEPTVHIDDSASARSFDSATTSPPSGAIDALARRVEPTLHLDEVDVTPFLSSEPTAQTGTIELPRDAPAASPEPAVKLKIAAQAGSSTDRALQSATFDLLGSGRFAAEHTQHLGTAVAPFAESAEGVPQSHRVQELPASISLPGPLRRTGSVPSADPESYAQVCEVGRVLHGRYTLECVLGRGGMGTVFKALDRQRFDLPESARHVALKVLDTNVSRRPEIVADLRREFYCAQALAHRNIVRVYELHHDEETAFFTMELLQGELLGTMLERLHPRPLERGYAWAIIRDVAGALAHAHSRSVVHGDLKPQNIMITDSGDVRVLDFGASGTATRQWATSDSLQRNRFPPVTLAYACCELLDGHETDPRDDLYALACLSYELLTGKHPFQRRRSTEARELGLRPLRPPGLSHRQWRALLLGLSWRRENRSLSVADWLSMLGLEAPPEHLPPFHALDSKGGRFQWRNALRPAALAASLLVALGLWAAFNRNGSQKHTVTTSAPAVVQPSMAQAAVTGSPAPGLPPDVVLQPPAAPAPSPAREQTASRPLQRVVASSSDAPPAEPAPRTAIASRAFAPPQITLSAPTYTVSPEGHFAEIDVRRSADSRSDSGFMWWTEGATARPGRDFVAQNRTPQVFLRGRHLAKLYIRILPNQSRTYSAMFYVHISAPSASSSLGAVTRATILIPPLTTGPDAKPIYAAQR